ncbi:PLP-dependent aminotransferase family protein [Paucibacter sp. DJ1R-11]|uniref:MocR-like pyridoxine biosynthesis transcription factor PdxR n=1 Tax=Paucibacter sp. DJ1R-11 TaxID=2893556 RepID=UPI0021E3A056|nr:PLP-dependent aminotransferase family protein [Paucibacter sp. DJ1R-11]MCV2363884.1 PLP-dependent aminotransferase family protein [Paucibacter sp. DJ1R-11]
MEPISEPTLAPPSALELDPAGMQLRPGLGLSRQIHAQIKARILQGQLSHGARLPTTRALAQALDVSRNSVLRAYEQLESEGLIEARMGAGSFVSALKTLSASETPVPLLQAGPAKPLPAPDPTPVELPETPLWQALQHYQPTATTVGQGRAFRHGLPALDLFPHALWSRLQARFWRRQARPDPDAALSYGDPAGLPRLRELIAAYLSHSRGLPCRPEQVLVTAGSQQAIAIAALALLSPGDRVGMESPGYRAAAAALGLGGARVLPVPLDEQGLRVGALRALGPVRLVYTTPSHQYPTGVVMSLQRRLELLAWARANDAYVLEDDYDGEYRFSGVPLAPMASLEAGQAGRTLYVGSFSKLLFPGLRLGYLVAPAHWLPTLARLRSVLDRQAAIADQAVLADFMAEGHFLRHVRRMRRAARERRDAFIEAWTQDLTPLHPRFQLPAVPAGLQVFLPLASRAEEQRLSQRAQAVGVEVGCLQQIGGLPTHSPQAGLVLGFATVPTADIRQAVRALADVWRGLL